MHMNILTKLSNNQTTKNHQQHLWILPATVGAITMSVKITI